MADSVTAMPVLRVVCTGHERPRVLGTFIRYPEGYREPPPATRVYTAPHLWIWDTLAEQGGDGEVDGLRRHYEAPSATRKRASTLVVTPNRKGELVRRFTCQPCSLAPDGIRPWPFHERLENWHELYGVADIPLAVLGYR